MKKEDVLKLLEMYADISKDKLRQHLAYFLNRISPTAAKLGMKLAIHPDDPPFSVFGLPRIVCNAEDLQYIIDSTKESESGLCFCTGSLGANRDNDIVSMVKQFSDRIHFVHLRNVRLLDNGQFYESDHLDGSVDLVQVIAEMSEIMQRREISLPMRPDHGHQFDLDAHFDYFPGYSAVGRLRGLAEIRGVEAGILG